jgi:hypothetical protein
MPAFLSKLFRRSASDARGRPSGDRAVCLPGGFSRDTRRDLALFDEMVRHIGWGGWPGQGEASRPSWKGELTRVKEQRRKVLGALRRPDAKADPVRAQLVEVLLIKGWHLVFHCYGMATGAFGEADPDDLTLRQADLQQAYLDAFEAIL